MPELPEVETVRKTLLKHLKGKKISNIDILYEKIFEGQDLNYIKQNIKNETINDIRRRGKWLIFVLDNYYLLSHLRMEGKYLYRKKGDEIASHEHVVITFSDDVQLRYKDVRKFGKMHFIKFEDFEKSKIITSLGLEPWDKNLTCNYLKDIYKNRKLPIKTVLLDQSIIVGIGNIYADEILFLSKINPFVKANLLTNENLNDIIKNTKIVLDEAIKKGGTTIRSYTSEEGVTGLFQNELYVHSREKEECLSCKTLIIKTKIGGRGTYYCPTCQK